MGIEYIIGISLVAAALAFRSLIGMFKAEFDAALATRRLVNTSRRRAEARLHARIAEFHEASGKDPA